METCSACGSRLDRAEGVCPVCQPVDPEPAHIPVVAVAGRPGPGVSAPDPLLLAEVARALEAAKRASARNPALAFVVSLILFLSLGVMQDGLAGALIIVVAVLLHELGHWLAMKALGYRNASITLLPLLGAVTVGSDPRPSGSKHAIVSLLGPVPGLVIGMALGAAWASSHEPLLLTAARIFLFLNAFNLLPLFPLDGGQVLGAALLGRHRRVDFTFRALAIVALGAFAASAQLWVLVAFSAFLLLGLPRSWRAAAVAQRLDPEVPPAERGAADAIPPGWLARIVAELAAQGLPPANVGRVLADQARAVWERICFRHATALSAALLLMAWVGALLLAWIGIYRLESGAWAALPPAGP